MQTNEQGDVILNIGANIRNAKAAMVDLSRATRNVFRAFSGQSVSSPQLDALKAKAEQSLDKIESLRQKITEMNGAFSDIPTDQYQRMIDKSNELEVEAERIEQDINNMRASTVDFSQQIANAEKNLEKVREQIYDQALKMNDLEENGQAFLTQAEAQPEAFQRANDELRQEQTNLAGIQSKMESAETSGAEYAQRMGEKIQQMSDRVSKGFKKIRDHAKSGAKSASQSFEGLNSVMKKGIKTLLKYGLGMRSFFVLFRKLRSSIVESYKELAETSPEISTSLESVKNSFSKLKMSIATAVEPLVTTFAPVVSAVADKLSGMMASVGSFFAALTGQDYVYRALGTQQNYADSLAETADNAGKAEKALDKYLSPLDDINRFTEASADTSTDGKTAANASVTNIAKGTIPSKFQEMAETVKGFFSDLFKPIKTSWNIWGESTIFAWKSALLSIKNTAGDILTAFKRVWTNGAGEKLTTNILKLWKTIGGIVVGVVDSFRTAWNKGGLGESVIKSFTDKATNIIGFIRNIAETFKTVWESGAGERIWTNILTIVRNVNNIIGGFWGKLSKAWSANNNGEKIWGAILGIVESVFGWFESISEITLDWLDDLDITPLFDAVSSLAEAFNGLVTAIGEKFKGVYEEILLPFAKWTIEKAVPTLIDWLATAFDTLSGFISLFPVDLLKTIAAVIATVFVAFKGYKIVSGIVAWFKNVGEGILVLRKAIVAHPIAASILAAVAAITALVTAIQIANKQKWEQSELKKASDQINEFSEELKTAAENMRATVETVKQNHIEVQTDVSQVETLKSRLQEIIKDGVIDKDEIPEYKTVISMLKEIDGFEDAWSKIDLSEDKEGNIIINSNIEDVNTSLDNLFEKWEKAQYINILQDSNRQLAQSLSANQKDIEKARANIDEAYSNLHTYYKSTFDYDASAFIERIIEKIDAGEDIWMGGRPKELFDTYITARDNLSEYTEAQEYNTQAYQDSWEALKYLNGETNNYRGALYLVESGIWDEQKALDTLGDSGINSIEGLKRAAGQQKAQQEAATSAVKDSYDSVGKKAESVSTSMKNAIGTVAGSAKTAATDIRTEFERGFSDAETATRRHIDSINKMLEVQGLTGLSFSQTQSIIASGQLPIPKLASGAVIPAGKPFLAMLGDQGAGRNLEAPERLIRQIVREEVASASKPSNNTYNVAAQVRGKTLFNVVIDEAEMRRNQTGINPFAMGGTY